MNSKEKALLKDCAEQTKVHAARAKARKSCQCEYYQGASCDHCTPKHTPGPWRFRHRFDYRRNPVGFDIFASKDLGRGRITTNRVAITPDCFSPENEANAKLISQAPNMLAAIKAAHHEHEHGSQVVARQIIAKALADAGGL